MSLLSARILAVSCLVAACSSTVDTTPATTGSGGAATTTAATTSTGGSAGLTTDAASSTGSGGAAQTDCKTDPSSCPTGSACHCGGPATAICECGTFCQSNDGCTDPSLPVCCMVGLSSPPPPQGSGVCTSECGCFCK